MSEQLYRVSYSILLNHADAEDAVQECLVKAWAARAKIRPDTFRAYVTRIAINECRNIQRKRMREAPVEQLPEEAGEPRENYSDLHEAINALPETLRTPLLLHYMESFPDKEIAKALGIGHSAVRNRIFRARKELEAMLRGKGVSLA